MSVAAHEISLGVPMPDAGSDRPPLVLIIDDEEEVLDVLADMLARFGYASMRARNGQAGLATLSAEDADIVLLDIAMPGTLDGVATLRVIKASHPDVPVIMVTANVDLDIAKATLRDGAFDYVSKPFDLGRLRDVLGSALLMGGKLPPTAGTP
jgi:DNA-binding NtrC family response regulator